MSNMSYCRFQNTLLAMEDCYESMCDEDCYESTCNEDFLNEDLSEEEENAKKAMLRLCMDMLEVHFNSTKDEMFTKQFKEFCSNFSEEE